MYPTFNVIHDVERGTDHLGIFAQQASGGHRHVGAAQGADHLVLALDHMRGRQQLARRLLAQHIALLANAQQEGRVGLPTLKLLNGHAVLGARYASLQVGGQFRFIETVGRQYIDQSGFAHIEDPL